MRLRLRRLFELRQAVVDKVEAYMRHSIVPAVACLALVGQLYRFPSYLWLGYRAVPRDLLHDMAVAIASAEIHPAVGSARIFTQRLLDDAHRFDELPPIHGQKEPQAADAVADGNLIGGLLLRCRLHQLLDGQPV